MRLILSDKVKLPTVYLVENEEELKKLPLGIPFIRGKNSIYNQCVKMLEFEVLWKTIKSSPFKLKWKDILAKYGYKNTYKHGIASSDGSHYGEYYSDKFYDAEHFGSCGTIDASTFLEEISYKVNIDVLQDLKLLPFWFEDIETTLKRNLAEAIVFNPTLFTKKLGMQLGGMEPAEMTKNVVIIDISSSIPEGVSSTILAYAKTLASQFYADVLITGTISTLYDYTELDSLDVSTIYSINGMNNDQVHFRKIMEIPKKYNTAIVFGDYHNPGQRWNGSKEISLEQGKELCKWEVAEIISFHTTSETELAGYGIWLDVPKSNIRYMKNWVTDLN